MKRNHLNRREFCAVAARATALFGMGGVLASEGLRRLAGDGGTARANAFLDELVSRAPRARYWTSIATGAACGACHEPGTVEEAAPPDHAGTLAKCLLCAQGCVIADGKVGRCRTRLNVSGEIRSLVYGRPLSIHTDPIEKKPFFHFLPGAAAFSLATAGCPLECKFCQNWEISQARPEDYPVPYTPPEAIVNASGERNAPVIAFTYNEPTVFTEYLTDIARVARSRGIRTVLVSCGFMRPEPLDEMCDVLDAVKIDLKGFHEDFYRDVCGASLRPVLDSIERIAKRGTHLEIVNLVVPTLNDSDAMLRDLARWIVEHAGADVPIHFTRFHPDYQLVNLPPTPVATLERARAIARAAGARFVYVGNVPAHDGNHTYCPRCERVIVVRQGFFILENHMEGDRCGYCGERIAGVWS
jgi:pyruvate formate lyase activating enzyme